MVVPPAREMDALLHLAREGDMRGLLRQATRLTELDQRYLPFADQLRHLAQRFESKAILKLGERHLEEAGEKGTGA
jgi:hypothetical protein